MCSVPSCFKKRPGWVAAAAFFLTFYVHILGIAELARDPASILILFGPRVTQAEALRSRESSRRPSCILFVSYHQNKTAALRAVHRNSFLGPGPGAGEEPLPHL